MIYQLFSEHAHQSQIFNTQVIIIEYCSTALPHSSHLRNAVSRQSQKCGCHGHVIFIGDPWKLQFQNYMELVGIPSDS